MAQSESAALNNQKRTKQQRSMQEDKQEGEKWDELLQPNVHVSSQQVPKSQDIEPENDRSLTLENLNSLALFPRMSIEMGIPLSKNMLSKDNLLYDSDSPPSDQEGSSEEKVEQPPVIDAEKWLEGDFDLGLANLPAVKSLKGLGENTKNVLRNLGNAQTQYALYNKEALQIIQTELSNPEKFCNWVRKLKLENFEGFKTAWNQSGSNQVRAFQRVYKKICWIFYVETAIPYILTSRMKNPKTKISHLKYIYRFLQGIANPQDFSYFKKTEK